MQNGIMTIPGVCSPVICPQEPNYYSAHQHSWPQRSMNVPDIKDRLFSITASFKHIWKRKKLWEGFRRKILHASAGQDRLELRIQERRENPRQHQAEPVSGHIGVKKIL